MSVRRIFDSAIRSNRYLFAVPTCGFKQHVSHTLIEQLRRKQNLEFGKQPSPPRPRSAWIEWNYEAELFSFCKRIKESIDPDLLLQSITQRSFILQEEDKQKAVGISDPVINTKENTPLVQEGKNFSSHYIKTYLRVSLPYFPEEGIQCVHDYLISEEVLGHIAKHLGMADIVQTAEYPVETATLSSCFFALIEAIRVSNDNVRAGNFVRDFIVAQLAGKNVNDFWKIENPVDKLNTIYANHGAKAPEPRLIGQAGQNTIMACYRVAFYNSDRMQIGIGFGESIEIAKDIAAADALRRLFRTSDRDNPIHYDLEIDIESDQKRNPSIQDWNEPKLVRALG